MENPIEQINNIANIDDFCGYLNNWADGIIVRHRNIDVVKELAQQFLL